MKRIALICFLSLTIAPAFAMELEEFFHVGHPCLPPSFYKEKYAKILASDESKDALRGYATQQLQKLAAMYRANTMAQDRGELAAVRYALFYTGSTNQLAAVQAYGKLVTEMSMHAIRKSLGVTMGMGAMTDEEKRELKQVSPVEFMELFKSKYREDDFMRVEHVEQMHAHRMLLELLEKKK